MAQGDVCGAKRYPMPRSISLSFLLALSLLVHAQRGTITGTVTALENGRSEPQPFASVLIKGTTTGASTDLDGKYLFKVEPGTWTVVTTMVGYAAVEKAVTVAADQTVNVDLQLNGDALEMKAVEVVKEKRADTESAVLMETRKSDQVVSGISRQQIAKGQDRTAGDVVKRIPGVTVIGDRFIMIRGLADRYNTVMLNDAVAPSLEADRRAFSFDLIPSGALDRILIYKSVSPDLPGDFSGGVVKVATVGVPEKNETRFNYSASFRPGTTFNDFFQSKTSGTDALGFDNGARTLPNNFPTNLYEVSDAQQLATTGRELPNNWTATPHTAGPDQRAGFFLARRFGKEDGMNHYGSVTSVDYTSTSLHYTAHNYNYNAYDLNTHRSDTVYSYTDDENIRSVRMSVMSNWSALIGKRTKLEFRNLFNQLGEDRTTLRSGRNLEEGNEVRNYAFRYQQRTIYSSQLHGSHELTDASKLDWTLGYGRGISKEPDFRRVRTVRDLATSDANTPYQLVVASSASTLDAGRFFSDLDETVMSGKLDFEQRITVKKEGLTPKLLAGTYIERKDREFSARWMSLRAANLSQFDQSQLYLPLDQVFDAQHINPTTGFKLEEGTNPSDRYTGANTLLAGYVAAQLTQEKKWNVKGGVRVEQNRQQLTSGTYGGQPVGVDKQLLFVLPSVNGSWNFSERSLVRAGWGQTVNRPEFRELAPFAFYDFSTNNVIYGNPKLKTATIQNADVRYEFYPSLNEVLSVGAFYKRFTDPIEMFYVAGTGGGGTRNFTFYNASVATSAGAEVEVRRSLNALFTEGWMSHVGVLFNGMYIHSQVDLGTTQGGQDSKRPMMGQSPYVLNAGLYYTDTDHKLQFNVLYNVCGPRLFAVGSIGIPNIYEMPRNVVDVTASKGLGKRIEVKLSVQDLLNQRVRLMQDSNADGRLEDTDEEVMSFRRGPYFSAGISLKF
mgnify:CR=1 FL=1